MTAAHPEEPGQDLPGQDHLPTVITHAAMNAAFDEGTAALLSAAVGWLARHREAWWVVYEHGWLRITDAATAQDLDQAAARLAQAESAADGFGQR